MISFSRKTIFLALFFLAICNSAWALNKVECQSIYGTYNGTCTGDYCFNVDDKIKGCVDFYRMIRDDNIACGWMPIGKTCVCTQPLCNKYAVANMPIQSLALVNCTDNTGRAGGNTCTPGPCYVGTDYKFAYPKLNVVKTCMQDWFAATVFNDHFVIYEVPPLKDHPACLFDEPKSIFNCMCKDPGCNANDAPAKGPHVESQHFECYKMRCTEGVDKDCTEKTSGTETCHGHMCYYLKSNVLASNTQTADEAPVQHIRDCLNYSFPDPLADMSFVTGFRFGKMHSQFSPCRGHKCNGSNNGGTTFTPRPFWLLVFSVAITVVARLQN